MKKNKIWLSLIVMLAVLFAIPSALAQPTTENHDSQVRVIVENPTTYNKAAGAAWDGTLVDTWVTIETDKTKSTDTMMTCVVAALNAKSYTQEGAESGYISSINGLAAFDGGTMSGWMGTLNDWFINEGLDAFTVANGKLEAGDEIRLVYTLDMGEDAGGSWNNNTKTLKALEVSAGTLSPTFSSATKAYTLTVGSDVTSVKVTPTATNKNFQVRTSVGSTVYKRTADIPVQDGTVITVVDGDPAWPTMNSASDVPAETYTITVSKSSSPASTNHAPTIKTNLENPLAANVSLGSAYTLNLSDIFEDQDKGDTLSYQVSVNGAAAVAADAQYSYTPVALGSVTLAFTATDDHQATSAGYAVNLTVTEAQVDVTINLVPSSVSLKFYTDETVELASEKVTDNGEVTISDGRTVHQYVLHVPAGEITYRGTDGTASLGGDVLTVSEAATVTMVRNNWYYNGTAFTAADDYTFSLTASGASKAMVLGTPYVEKNKRYTPTLMVAGVSYNGTVTLAQKWLDDYFVSGQITNKKTTNTKYTKTAQNQTLPIAAYKKISVTAPTTATTTFYQQEKNYVVKGVTPDATKVNADGTTTYVFKGTATHSNYMYRVMQTGKVTQAGYLNDGSDVTVTFPERSPSDATSSLSYDDRSVLLNIDDTNELAMTVGETFKLCAYRAAWEVVSSVTANIMIEPDFHYTILSGADVIAITPTTESTMGADYTSGNASNNWANVTALKEGTAIVAVTYDAMDITGAQPGGSFGASDPARVGVFVVNVGTDTTIDWNPVSSDGDWDAELDTVYYTGDHGVFTVAPEGVTALTVQNVNGTTLGAASTVTANADGSFSVPVTSGANVITATTASGTDVMVVRAREVQVTITNNTTSAVGTSEHAPVIAVGDSVTISIDHLDMPVPKMSGIYNPGYLGTAKTCYSLNGSYDLLSAGTQYDFSDPTKSAITFTACVPGTNTLEGMISLSVMGDDFGNHRNITDAGRAANTSASEKFGSFGALPTISFEVENGAGGISYEEATGLKSVSIMAGNAYNNGFKLTSTSENTATKWTKTTSAMSEDYMKVSALITPKSYYNTMELRYWYEGEAAKTIAIKSGVTTTLEDLPRTAEKTLNLQLRVTPGDSSLGGTRIYSYVVYCDTALQCVHPIITGLDVKSQADSPMTLINDETGSKGISYTCTNYTLQNDVSATSITLTGTMLQKFTSTEYKTADQSDGVVLTKWANDIQVGEAVTLKEAGDVPSGTWTSDAIDITDCDTLKLTVTSFVDPTISRTYVIRVSDPLGKLDLSADTLMTQKGKTFQVTLSLPGSFNGFDFNLGWDCDQVEFVSAEWAEAIAGNVVYNSSSEDMRIYMNETTADPIVLADGKLVTLTFKAKEVGTTKFDFEVVNLFKCDANHEVVNLKPVITSNLEDGVTAYLRGDVDLDGAITIIDANEIQLALAKYITLTPAQQAAGTLINGESTPTIEDVNRIQLYLAHLIEEL